MEETIKQFRDILDSAIKKRERIKHSQENVLGTHADAVTVIEELEKILPQQKGKRRDEIIRSLERVLESRSCMEDSLKELEITAEMNESLIKDLIFQISILKGDDDSPPEEQN